MYVHLAKVGLDGLDRVPQQDQPTAGQRGVYGALDQLEGWEPADWLRDEPVRVCAYVYGADWLRDKSVRVCAYVYGADWLRDEPTW